MTTAHRTLTVDEFRKWPDEATSRNELVEGLVVTEPRPGYPHGAAQVSIASALHEHVSKHGLGRVVSDVGFVLARDPDTVRAPDVAFVSRDRLGSIDDLSGWLPGVPDLAVEIRSPHDRASEVRGKIADYLAAGAREVWVADIERRELVVYRELLSPRTLSASATVEGGELLPGFAITVADLLGA